MIAKAEILRIKGEINMISSLIAKGNKIELELKLDIQLRSLGFLTINSSEEHLEEIDLLKDHVWALIEKLNRRIV